MLGYVYRKGEVYCEDVAHDLFLSDDEAYELLEELSDWGSIKRPKRKDKYNVYRVPAKGAFKEGQPRPVGNLQTFLKRRNPANIVRFLFGSVVLFCLRVLL